MPPRSVSGIILTYKPYFPVTLILRYRKNRPAELKFRNSAASPGQRCVYTCVRHRTLPERQRVTNSLFHRRRMPHLNAGLRWEIRGGGEERCWFQLFQPVFWELCLPVPWSTWITGSGCPENRENQGNSSRTRKDENDNEVRQQNSAEIALIKNESSHWTVSALVFYGLFKLRSL